MRDVDGNQSCELGPHSSNRPILYRVSRRGELPVAREESPALRERYPHWHDVSASQAIEFAEGSELTSKGKHIVKENNLIIGAHLRSVSAEGLHKSVGGFQNIEDFTHHHWGYERRYTFYLMESAKEKLKLECTTPEMVHSNRDQSSSPPILPDNERALRALSQVEPELQLQVSARASEISGTGM